MNYVVAYGISNEFEEALVELIVRVGDFTADGYTLSGNLVHVVWEGDHYLSQPMVLFEHELDGEEE